MKRRDLRNACVVAMVVAGWMMFTPATMAVAQQAITGTFAVAQEKKAAPAPATEAKPAAEAKDKKGTAGADGAWTLDVKTDDGQTLTSTLKLAKDGDKLGGTFTGMDGKEVKATDVSMKDGELAFTVKLDFQGTDLVAKFKLKQDGDKLKGKVDYDLGGQTGTLDVDGRRGAAAVAKTGKDDGEWKLEVVTDDGQTLTSALKLKKDGDKLAGTYVGMDGKEVKATDLSLKDKDLAFTVKLDFQGTDLVAKFKLKMDGDALKGKVDYDLGGQTGTLDVNGKRGGGGDVKVAGKWAIEVKTDDGQTLKSTVKFTKEGEKVGGIFTGADGKEVKVEDSKLAGDELAFKINIDFDGTPLVAKFKGKVAGEAYKGTVDYDLGGQTGSLPFEAKRSAD